MNDIHTTCFDAIAYYGRTSQVLVAVEELAELQKALLKNINRGEDNCAELLEEMADVRIMLEQLQIIYDIDPRELDAAIARKIERLRKRFDLN